MVFCYTVGTYNVVQTGGIGSIIKYKSENHLKDKRWDLKAHQRLHCWFFDFAAELYKNTELYDHPIGT